MRRTGTGSRLVRDPLDIPRLLIANRNSHEALRLLTALRPMDTTMTTTLNIDKEFKALIPPLSADERAALEVSLLADGCRDALVTWNGTLVDGHNRYEICQAHDIPFVVVEREFANRNEVLSWMIQNQLGRRNISDYTRGRLALRLEDVIAVKAKANQGTRTDIRPNLDKSVNALKTVADVADMSRANIAKVKAVEAAAPPVIKEAAEREEISIHRAYELTKALETVKVQNPRFYQETVDRGYITNLDGEDVPLIETDPTLLRVMTTEDEYERVKRQEAHINYKRDNKANRAADEYVPQGYDACQTPPEALDPLLPYLKPEWTIWECASGEGLLVEGLYDSGFQSVTFSDILKGQNFFEYEPPQWDCIVTNPPYSLKFRWLERCYALDKPFALLLPVETLGAKTAQEFFRNCGVEVIFLDKRINFKMPNKGWEGAGAQFPVAWFTYGLNIGQQITFARMDDVVHQ